MHISIIYLFILFFSIQSLFSQNKLEKEKNRIVGEGMALYTLILSNWTSNDIYYEHEFNTKIIQGYLSYKDKDTVKTIFWRELDTISAEYKARTFKNVGDTDIVAEQQQKKPADMRIIHKTIRYQKMIITKKNAEVVEDEREPTDYEKMLMNFRATTYKMINSDTAYFKRYEGTQLKVVLLDEGKIVKSYIYSSSMDDAVVPIGGDYLITFDKKLNEIIEKYPLHNSLILLATEYKGKSYDASKSTHHNHKGKFGSNLITPTDVAMLLLYKNRMEWDEHHVVSDKYTCIFTLVDRKLQIISTAEFNYMKKKRTEQDKETGKSNWH